MSIELMKKYVQEISENAIEAKEQSDDLFQSGRNLAFAEALGILQRYFICFEPDVDLSEIGLDIDPVIKLS